MQDNATRDEFVRVSQYLGRNPAYVQGGGGNTSAKLHNNRMLVKASGVTLASVSQTEGYADVDFAAVREYIKAPSEIEDDFNASVISSNVSEGFRPSMETGFHAILDGFVLHSHSVYANVLTCSQEGGAILTKLFPQAAWIPYAPPGRKLTLKILELTDHSVFFLQNHGLVVRAQTSDSVIAAHEEVNTTIRQRLGLESDFDPDSTKHRSRAFMDSHILFPDQVIFTNPTSTLDGTQAQHETLAAYAYIHNKMDELGFQPLYLKPADAEFLLGMDAEKFRGSAGAGS